jgi:hypothetical protein
MPFSSRQRSALSLIRRGLRRGGYYNRKRAAMRQQAANPYFRRRTDRSRPLIGTLQGARQYQARLLHRARAKYVRRHGYTGLRY